MQSWDKATLAMFALFDSSLRVYGEVEMSTDMMKYYFLVNLVGKFELDQICNRESVLVDKLPKNS